jgi:hypothetical protein
MKIIEPIIGIIIAAVFWFGVIALFLYIGFLLTVWLKDIIGLFIAWVLFLVFGIVVYYLCEKYNLNH